MDPQLSNALGLVKKYQKLAFLWHFENFLSLLVTAKNGHFGLKSLLLGLKSPEKWFLRCNFKIAVAREFSIFFAHNFKSETSDTMFENFGGTIRTRQRGIPASHTHAQLFFVG